MRAGHRQERAALDAAAVAIYSSRWAAESALERYDADPAKVHVIPFGANVEPPASGAEVARLVEARPADRCRLVWIGSEWERKRGDLAVAVTQELCRRGLLAEVTLAGAGPPSGVGLPDTARHLGWIDKSTPEGQASFRKLLSDAHFLLLPTAAETFGIVFCEASAFGVPSLATNVGGVPDAVESGANGVLLPPDAGPADYASTILDLMGTPARYRELAKTSRARFEERLNWRVATRRALDLMAALG